jgi:hypothetical protein
MRLTPDSKETWDGEVLSGGCHGCLLARGGGDGMIGFLRLVPFSGAARSWVHTAGVQPELTER